MGQNRNYHQASEVIQHRCSILGSSCTPRMQIYMQLFSEKKEEISLKKKQLRASVTSVRFSTFSKCDTRDRACTCSATCDKKTVRDIGGPRLEGKCVIWIFAVQGQPRVGFQTSLSRSLRLRRRINSPLNKAELRDWVQVYKRSATHTAGDWLITEFLLELGHTGNSSLVFLTL